MTATKHSRVDDEAGAPPLKKTKVETGHEAQLKQSKKDKKKKKKRAEEGKAGKHDRGTNEEPDDEVDLEAQRLAEKEAKKERKQKKKKEKKSRESQRETEASQAEEMEQGDEEKDKKGGEDDESVEEMQKTGEKQTLIKDKKSKREKKKQQKEEVASGDKRSSVREYVQTMSLSSVAQGDIDAFVSTNHISITDPRNKDKTRHRPVIGFEHLPSTNLLEKKPSPFADYSAPTPIQAASWPYTLSGRDVVGVAETGSGKTLAFALPCVEAVSDTLRNDGSSSSSKATHGVVVSPTRELAMQTHVQLARLARQVGLGCTCVYGGASKDEQRAALSRRHGADVIVATPGRLKDLMADGTIDLSAARFVVLDEADRMLDTGFEDDVRAILGACRPREQRQTLMFTATWPQSVQALAASFMVDPVRIAVGAAAEAHLADGGSGAVELQANARITQTVEVMDAQAKEGRLLQIVRQHQQGKQRNDRILVFCLYKKEATRVEMTLRKRGVRVVGIHGDLRQEQRTRSLEAFKSGETPVLVATDVAARGLDIPQVKLVINVTFPLTIEDYVHRIGRTGRAGNTGEAITFFTIQDKAHSGALVNILKGANQPVPDDLLKFGTTVKKKTHDMYGSFFKDVDMNQKATKITFD